MGIDLDKIIDFDVLSDPEKTRIQERETVKATVVDKPKRKRRKSSKSSDDETTELTMTQSKTPYIDTYEESIATLKGVQNEASGAIYVIDEETDHVRKSKTMKRKYDYITSLMGTKAQLINIKINAIKEIGNYITQSHNLELKREKDLKIDNSVDTGKDVIDFYRSFVNTPKASLPNFVNDQALATGNDFTPISTTAYQVPNEVTPQQHMMILEQDPNIKTVVVYDANTGNKWFDVRNLITGESIRNVDLPDPMMLENLNINTNERFARDSKLDLTYPLIVV